MAVAGAAAMLLLGVGVGRAQAPERIPLVVAALEHLRGTLPDGRVGVDPSPLCAARLAGWSCPPEVDDVLARLGLLPRSREFAVVCLSGPASCRLFGVDALVRVEPEAPRGDEATVVAEVWYKTDPRTQRLGHRREVLELQRRRGRWEVRGEREEQG